MSGPRVDRFARHDTIVSRAAINKNKSRRICLKIYSCILLTHCKHTHTRNAFKITGSNVPRTSIRIIFAFAIKKNCFNKKTPKKIVLIKNSKKIFSIKKLPKKQKEAKYFNFQISNLQQLKAKYDSYKIEGDTWNAPSGNNVSLFFLFLKIIEDIK